ncbi:hypothetical protein V495_08794 [Pseudogymnoascus sp. VKM F-4514 (FW-929)]|nr:hypothetical protein V495_08794 [Pseudogymnoascus sp. VKM F-4514 (FW-929)]KFY54129.1 hypothetical protein V497_07933 [Pseudogymnoascus sp. VKM F-4516 (FW-969)]
MASSIPRHSEKVLNPAHTETTLAHSLQVYGNRISKEGHDAEGYTYYPVAIIGAGESGIAMGCRLKEKFGFDQFRLFDRQSGIGGTWWINKYPGVACDIPAAFYSFSFAPNHKWSSIYPPGPEIVKYLVGVCEQYEIIDKIQLNSDVISCCWNETEGVWELEVQELVKGVGDLSSHDRRTMLASHGESSVLVRTEKIRAKVLISAVGGLVEPNRFPETIPGVESFQGPIFHSARWRYDVDLKDKQVLVVGTGCSAAQFVPELTTKYGAKSVTQLMRSPPWVVPSQIPPFGFSEEAWTRWSPWLNTYVPGFAKLRRLYIATRAEYDFRFFGDSDFAAKEREKAEVLLLGYMKSKVPEKYHEMLTPDYGFCCKRIVNDANWFNSLNDEKVVLSTRPLTHVHEDRVTLGPIRGSEEVEDGKTSAGRTEVIPADVIILANGFETLNWLHPLEVIGRSGESLEEVFNERGGPQLYMGSAMDGFPNFFVIFGPNTVTGHSSVVLASENMVNYAMRMIGPILNGDASSVEVKKEAEMAWTADLQKSLKKRVWNIGGCRNWYKGEDGWNSTTYPYSQIWFSLLCMFPNYRHWNYQYTTKGLVKKRAKTVLQVATLSGIATGLYFAQRAGLRLGWKEGVASVRGVAVQLLNTFGHSLVRSKAFDPQTPILIQRPETIDYAQISVGAGIPAIVRWFRGEQTRIGDDDVFFQEEYLKPFESIVLPYELVTPVFNSKDGQDLLSEFIAENDSSLSQYLPASDVTIKELLRDCALAGRDDAPEREASKPKKADITSIPQGAKPGESLTEHQVELLRRHAPLFQKFHSFHAPLELIIAASRQNNGSAQFGLPNLYIAQAQIADLPQQLRNDLPTPELVLKAGKGDVYDANIWIGTPPTFTPLHKDPNPNLFVQLLSSKKVRIFEPRKGQAIFAAVRRKIGASPTAALRGEEMMQGHERVELKEAVWDAANLEGHEVTVRPGDALFIPKGWWHSIKSEGDGLNASANWWFR